ncbi:MFS transporter [Rhodococcus sp. NPDC127530]|uniref:MFS transporter n=1 Tax=unclassified Rhodococcus (in: high G+C Gram-positive bacteria) TaxID=192944 RepID=UPI00364535B1
MQTAAVTPSLRDPLRNADFTVLVAVQCVTNVCVWVFVVAVQWTLTVSGESSTVIASVQTALAIPFLLLALPMGVWGERGAGQVLMQGALLVLAGAAVAAAVLASIGDVPAWLMLAAVGAVGVGLSTITIAWQSLMPHIVGRPLAGTGAILDGASYNGARAIGPIIGGALLTATTSEALFLALGVVFAVLVVPLRSRRRVGSVPRSSERMLPALAASTRFVWNSAWTRRLLYRLSVFGMPSSCLWALLPVIAYERLGLSSSRFGLMFGLVGFGAVVGTVAVMPLRRRMTQNAFICAGSLAYAAVLAAVATVSNVVVVAVLMVVVGASWVGVQSSWMMAAHGALPTWIRARVIALMLLVFQGCQAVGSLVWGALADIVSLEVAFAAAAVVMMCAGMGALVHGIVPAETISPTLDDETRSAVPLAPVAEESAPVRVTVTYRVRPGGDASFRTLRRDLARARRRLGARRWTAEVGTDRVIERFDFRDVAEYRRYLSTRLTDPERCLLDRIWVDACAERPISRLSHR